MVGPSDPMDPNFILHLLAPFVFRAFIGPYFYHTAPELYNITGPVTWIDYKSAATISFYGETDPLVPVSQGERLKAALDAAGVPNELTFYPGGHADWPPEDAVDMQTKTVAFFNQYF